ncbi:MAG: MAC/perforin domain-containing protein [Pseudomonadota bacterium]
MSKTGQSVRAIKAALMLGVMISAGGAPLAPSLAQEAVVNDTGVYGKNVARADFPGGSYRMIAEREWGRYDENDKLIRTYVELRRDDWAVELRQPNTDVFATIDTLRNAVLETDPNTNVLTEFAKIGSVAPRGDMPKVPLPRIPADYPDWYKDAWNARFNPANQGFRPGASVAANPAQSGQGATFAIGSSQSTIAQPTPGQPPAQGSTGGFNPFSNPGAPQQTGARQPTQTAQNSGGFDPNAPWLAAQGGGQPQTAAAPPVQQNNPFAPPSSNAPPSQQNNPFAPPAGQQQNPFSQQSGPPVFARGNGDGGAARRPGAQTQGTGAFQPQFGGGQGDLDALDPKTQFDGVWVAIGETYKRTSPEPPLDSPKRAAWEARYIAPRMIRITGVSDTSFVLENVNNTRNPAERAPIMGSGQFGMRKAAENRYTGSGANVSIQPGPDQTRDIMRATFPSAFAHMSGQYRRATTSSGLVLSRDRTKPEVLEGKPLISDEFANLTKVYQPSLVSYNPAAMNLLDPRAGRMAQIFERHQEQYYAFDPEVGRNVLYGLRGAETPTVLAENNRISVTSEAETQAQVSKSMGQSVAGIGYNFAREQTRMARSRSGTSTEFMLARIPRYALMVDLPNMELDYFFKNMVEELMTGRATYNQFFDRYGTHYASSVTYGGLGVSEETSQSLETAESLADKYSGGLNATATSKTGQQLGNSNMNNGNSSFNSSGSGFSTSSRQFRAVGGSGSTNAGSFQVDDKNVAPIMYDLRPISELINPALFDTGGDPNKIRRLLQVRQALQNRINARQRSLPKLSTLRPKSSEAYRITFNNIRCTSSGSRSRSSILLNGEINAYFNDSLGANRELSLLSKAVTEDTAETETIQCGPNAYPFGLVGKQMVVVKSIQSPVNVTFGVGPKALYDYKKPTFTTGDRIRQGGMNDMAEGIVGIFKPSRNSAKIMERDRKNLQLKASTAIPAWDNTFRGVPNIQPGQRNNGQWRIGGQGGPTLVVNYTVQRLQ